MSGEAGAERALAQVKRRFEGWHRRFTRFEPESELSRLNANPARSIVVSNVVCRFVEAAIAAAANTDGLVDPTLLHQIESAGYRDSLNTSLPLADALRITPAPRPARPSPERHWRRVSVDRPNRIVTRPPGIMLDSGGIAKGMFADMLAQELRAFDAFALDCGGDIRIGGQRQIARAIRVDDPLGSGTLHEFRIVAGGVATSGIGRRSWLDREGRPAHHLLDPFTGRPAFTGILQATALAPTALEAETLAKAALLSGPNGAQRWLRHGGVLVFDDGRHTVVNPGQATGTNWTAPQPHPTPGAGWQNQSNG